MAVARITSVAPSMPAVAEVSTAPKATAGARAAKKRKKTDAYDGMSEVGGQRSVSGSMKR